MPHRAYLPLQLVQSSVMVGWQNGGARRASAKLLAMAEDRDKDTPSLEPPSLFGRKKKPPRPAAEPPEPTESTEPPETTEPPEPPEPPEPAVTSEATVAPEAYDGPT